MQGRLLGGLLGLVSGLSLERKGGGEGGGTGEAEGESLIENGHGYLIWWLGFALHSGRKGKAWRFLQIREWSGLLRHKQGFTGLELVLLWLVFI